MVKKKYYIFNCLLSVIILFVILLQSVHSLEHFFQKSNHKICLHEANQNKSNITHAHIEFEDCFVCQFAFNTYEFTPNFDLNFNKKYSINRCNFFYSKEISIPFKGSLFSLRGPPSV